MIFAPTGRKPCGVFDHAAATALWISAHSAEPVLFRSGGAWGLVRDRSVRLVHAHYPAVGFGWSVWPVLWTAALRAAGKTVVLTIHEYAAARAPRRAYIRALARTASLVFTPCATLRARIGRRARAIPSGTNIDRVRISAGERERLRARYGLVGSRVVGFFGFTKTKGFDRFLDLARRLPDGWKAIAIGAIPPASPGDRADGLVRTGYLASPADASRHLQIVDVFFLPYPDGVSDRRGSFWAALDHGIPVISTEGPQTTDVCRGPGIRLIAGGARDPVGSAIGLLADAAAGPRPTLPASASREAICAAYMAGYGLAPAGVAG